jgi:putative flippase GtrA
LPTRFFYFLLTGGVAATLNWLSRFLFSEFFTFEVSVTLAFFVGLLSGYFLMRYFVFEYAKRQPIKEQAKRYFLINMFALILTVISSTFLARFVLPGIGIIENAEALGHLFGIVLPVFVSYFGHKIYTFKQL